METKRQSGDSRFVVLNSLPNLRVMKSKNDENDLDYIVVCLCRGLALYDANEIVQSSRATSTRDGNSEGYSD